MARVCPTYIIAAMVLPSSSLALVFDSRAYPQAAPGIEQQLDFASSQPQLPSFLNQQIPNIQSSLNYPQQLRSSQIQYPRNLLSSSQQQQLGNMQSPYAQSLIESPQQQQMGNLQDSYFQSAVRAPQQPPEGIAEMTSYSQPSFTLPRQSASAQSFVELPQGLESTLNSYSRDSPGSPFSAQRSSPMMLYGAPAPLESTVMALQTELAREKDNEMQLVSSASQRQQELSHKQEEISQMNETLVHMKNVAEANGLLKRQLANATAANNALKAELVKIREEEKRDAEELSNQRQDLSELRKKLRSAEDKAEHSEFVKARALRVMKDVQLAQEKVQRTEEIIRRLIPNQLVKRRMQQRATPAERSTVDDVPPTA